MKLIASHTINLGIARITLSRTGISISSGIPGIRASLNSKGEAGVRLGIPGTGLSFNKRKKILKKK